MSEATEIASMGITTMIELMQARDEIKRLKEALAKQEQGEPVAKNENGSITWLVDNWPQNCLLYTTPQPAQKPWVELADEEVAEIERNSITRRQAIRAIEAKLKEKNT